MRLLNIKTRELEPFFGKPAPPYAVLSHTWGRDEDELSFDDARDGRWDKAGSKAKFDGCAAQALKDGLVYIWIDTCCIDKTNSVELNEAINSMFRWYEEARVCYVYLAEFSTGDGFRNTSSVNLPPTSWFRRGWTLQELLAPRELRFYDQSWNLLGDRRTVAKPVSTLTGIPLPFLAKYKQLKDASVAQRMSWASTRVTKREEDLAYCLIGIFGISMAMNYGERLTKAFDRLQRKIMEEIEDDSILAWGFGSNGISRASAETATGLSAGALAQSPSDFAGCGGIVAFPRANFSERLLFSPGFIQATVPLTELDGATFGMLRCGLGRDKQKPIGIPLRHEQQNWYIRPHGEHPREIPAHDGLPDCSTVRISTACIQSASPETDSVHQFYINSFAAGLELIEVHPRVCWDGKSPTIQVPSPGTSADSMILLRFAANGVLGDVVVVLEWKDEDGKTHTQSHVMVADRLTGLTDLSRNFSYLRKEALGWQTVNSIQGHIRLTVELEDETARLFLVDFAVHEGPAEMEVNVAMELSLMQMRLGSKLEKLQEENAELRKAIADLQRNNQLLVEAQASEKKEDVEMQDVEERVAILEKEKMDLQGKVTQLEKDKVVLQNEALQQPEVLAEGTTSVLSQMGAQMAILEKEKMALQERVSFMEQVAVEATSELNTMRRQVSKAQQQNSSLTTMYLALKADHDKARAALASRDLGDQEDANKRALQKQVVQFREELREADKQRSALKARTVELEAENVSLKRKAETLALEVSEIQHMSDHMRMTIGQAKEQVSSMNRRVAELEDKIARQEAAAEDRTANLRRQIYDLREQLGRTEPEPRQRGIWHVTAAPGRRSPPDRSRLNI
ncbi:heterokaryon incompatibility protein-domain-containing protein [Echria macrotheca]|uniref:Heterokaryon incompatibility protein-domain-containing protein n=1 Tax=Echria macrotheca TaxID=438768 RepID=A0AAJ0F9Y9_9PEZI|nr:heterokaryon incompatibility protein-domain-containing protein [Echria macrotheca]